MKIKKKEIKGPKVGSSENILEGFIKSKNVSEKICLKKKQKKVNFFFQNKSEKDIFVEDLLINLLPNLLASINWKKSMKWSTFQFNVG